MYIQNEPETDSRKEESRFAGKDVAGWGSLPLNLLRVCVDSRIGGELSGRVYCRMSREMLPFRNLGEFLLRTDALFDEMDYPQSFQEKRSFAGRSRHPARRTKPEAVLTEGELLCRHGDCCTFDVLVSSRRRASWQGALIQFGKPDRRFQSEKQLLDYMIEETNEAEPAYR